MILRVIVIFSGLMLLWWISIIAFDIPSFILPTPHAVFYSLVNQPAFYLHHSWITLQEMLLGSVIALLLAMISAIIMIASKILRYWLMPILVISQALPVFALAPILVLLLGYGISSKVAMAALIIYFPAASALYDGLRHATSHWIDMAYIMRASPWRIIRYIRLPAAMPALASGLRIAAASAPIGAVVGEWVGAGKGLGFIMLHANARSQNEKMFAALLCLSIMALLIYYIIDYTMNRLIFWQKSTV